MKEFRYAFEFCMEMEIQRISTSKQQSFKLVDCKDMFSVNFSFSMYLSVTEI